MGKTLVERMLTKQILTKEFDAEEYIKQYTVMGNVRYTAYFKTRPIGLTYYPIKCSNEIIKLSREAAKTVVVLVATGNERLGFVRAFVCSDDRKTYKIANQSFYHIDKDTNALVVDGVQTTKGYRGYGVGTAALNFIKDIAIQSNCSTVELDSVKTAIGFYSKLGFTASGKQTCGNGALHTMKWNVEGEYNTTKFSVNELNLMMQRGREVESKLK